MQIKRVDGVIPYAILSGKDIVTGTMTEDEFQKLSKKATEDGRSDEVEGYDFYRVVGEQKYFFKTVQDCIANSMPEPEESDEEEDSEEEIVQEEPASKSK